jgi:hypothetical protein
MAFLAVLAAASVVIGGLAKHAGDRIDGPQLP